MGIKNFRIVTPDIDEHMERELPPEELVRRISAEKARAVREQAGMDAVVIAADTVVALDGAVLGKPADELEAFKMLSTLSGCRHQVYTGLTVLRGEERHTVSEETTVAFRELSEEEISCYIQTGEPMDKAGAYGIQGFGALLIEGIQGITTTMSWACPCAAWAASCASSAWTACACGGGRAGQRLRERERTDVKDFFRHNGILILIAAILLALVTAVVSMLFGGVADPLSNLVGILTTPVRNGITAVTNWAEEKYNDAFELEQMKEELAGLKQRNAELEAQAREAEAALQENERLRNLLELQPKEWSCDKAAAMVTARSTSNWESTLTIGKGSAAGIAVDDCVVDEYWNLVGVVAEVGENWATVRTLVDSDTEMGGQLARTGGAAILEGDFALMGEGRLKLTYLPENSELIAGDLVTTSGRGGGIPRRTGGRARGGGAHRCLRHDPLRRHCAGDRSGRPPAGLCDHRLYR